MDVFARWDADPDGLMESALLERKFGTVILGAIGVRATLLGEVFVAVIFEGMEFVHLGGGLFLRFGVHVISFPTGSMAHLQGEYCSLTILSCAFSNILLPKGGGSGRY